MSVEESTTTFIPIGRIKRIEQNTGKFTSEPPLPQQRQVKFEQVVNIDIMRSNMTTMVYVEGVICHNQSDPQNVKVVKNMLMASH